MAQDYFAIGSKTDQDGKTIVHWRGDASWPEGMPKHFLRLAARAVAE